MTTSSRRGIRLGLRSLAFYLIGLGLGLTAWGAQSAETEPLDRILQTARGFLAEGLSASAAGETHVEIGQLDSRLRLTRCAEPPRAQWAPGSKPSGNTTVNVRCAAPVAWSIFVPVAIERHAEVLVVAQELARAQVIGQGDLQLEKRDLAQLSGGYLTDPAAVVGLTAKRRLMPGQVLTSAQVTPRRLVERGQEVVLYVVKPGLMVRMAGEALESGTEGERIRVRNRSSKRVVEGYVEPSGAVRVAL